MQPFKVDLKEAENFAKVWKFKGLSMPLSDVHVQFAVDFANICIRSFVEDMMQQAAARKAAAEQAPKSLIVEA